MEYPREVAARLLAQLRTRSLLAVIEQQEAAGDPVAKRNRRRRQLAAPPPTEAQLSELLDIAFEASLVPEEGRFPKFALAFIAPNGARKTGYAVAQFGSRWPLAAATIGKIAACAEPDGTMLGVAPSGNRLRAWGLVHVGTRPLGTEISQTDPAFVFGAPFLIVRVRRPGVLSVYYDQHLQMLFVRGNPLLYPAQLDLTGRLRDGAHLPGDVADELRQIAARMCTLGHGGALLVTEPGVRVRDLDVSHPFDPPSTVLQDAFKLERVAAGGGPRPTTVPAAEKAVGDRVRAERRLSEALDFVAALTRVDGAVHITTDLLVHGFGAKIGAPGEPRLYQIDPRDPARVRRHGISALSGTRHRSAARFCARQRGLALALVASQDGDLSLFGRRPNGSVVVVRPYVLGAGL